MAYSPIRKLKDWFASDAPMRLISEHRAGFAVLRQDSTAALRALEALLPDPDRAFEGAKIFKPGTRTHAGMVTLADHHYFLKRYNCRGWHYRLQNAWRRSRAMRTWWVAWEFLGHGVPVPQPLLCLEERSCRLLGRSYVLMAFAEGSDRLREAWPKLTEKQRASLLLQLGEVLGKMHAAGCLHGDLKWSNILIQVDDQQQWQVGLVDLDGSRTTSRPSRAKALKDLRRFCKDLDNVATLEEIRIFQCCWNSWTRALNRGAGDFQWGNDQEHH